MLKGLQRRGAAEGGVRAALHRVGLRTSSGRTRAVGGELVEDAGAGVLTGGAW